MLRNLAAGLFEHGQIVTTIPRAKAVQPMVEKIITAAKSGTLAARRNIIAKLGGDRRGFEWLFLAKAPSEQEKEFVEKLRDQRRQFFDLPASSEVERNRYGELRKSPKLVKHIFDRVAPKFADRAGGYTRILRMMPRAGDSAPMALMQLVDQAAAPVAEAEAAPAAGKKTKAKAKTKGAAKPRARKAAAA